jgi:peptidoglycan/xylan/chitin deacetylase (PgdA/CDA1 family)
MIMAHDPRAEVPVHPLFPIPVLMYHDLATHIEEIPAGHQPYVVPLAAFEAQMKILADLGVSGTRLDVILDRGAAAPGGRRCCVLTFDDGHESNCSLALSVLQGAAFSATFFVTAGWIGRSPYMSWEQLRRLAAAGMEIGSHSMTHRPPATLTPSELYAEMADSKKLLEDKLGVAIVTSSSPTGFFNPHLIPAVQEAGYRGLCIGRLALWSNPEDRFRIPRLSIKRSTSHAGFRHMVRGRRWYLGWMRGGQMARDGLKAALGVEGYSRLRRGLLRLAPSRRPRPR